MRHETIPYEDRGACSSRITGSGVESNAAAITRANST